ncbi:MAG: class I SAM-dependent DNA methyltransferase [Alphaproteobacteria bacterium]|nr:class I SAM-dependent DNA methyltransferase [Alphaproteobacteria bacterium]
MIQKVKLVSKKLTLKKLEHQLRMAAHIITGPIDASDYKIYIFPILFFKRINDVYNEKFETEIELYGDENLSNAAEQHTIQIPKGCRWSDVFSTTKDVGKALQRALRCVEKANPHLYGIFGDAPWTDKKRLPDSLITELLNHFHQIPMGVKDVRDDDMGRAYEYLIKKFADKSNKKAGEFYTPRNVIRLMVNVLDPKVGEIVYDPACGTGRMLLETIHHVQERNGDPRLLKFKGQEKNLTTEAIARMNLFLHGMENFQIIRGDTLRDPKFTNGNKLETFDCVIANPPFSLGNWGHDRWSPDQYNRHVYGVAPKKNGDFAWIMHMYSSMRDNTGRMVVVMPHGVLFRGSSEAKIRETLTKNGALECVIGLAKNLFYGTGISACLLVFRKDEKTLERKEILFINADEIYTKGRAQNTMSEGQADEIYDIYKRQNEASEKIKGVSRWVPIDEIEENDFNLNIARYVQKPLEEESVTVEEALKDFKQKLSDLEESENELKALLVKEGFDP